MSLTISFRGFAFDLARPNDRRAVLQKRVCLTACEAPLLFCNAKAFCLDIKVERFSLNGLPARVSAEMNGTNPNAIESLNFADLDLLIRMLAKG